MCDLGRRSANGGKGAAGVVNIPFVRQGEFGINFISGIKLKETAPQARKIRDLGALVVLN